MAAEAIERLEAALGEAAGTDVELERPSDSAHGDYATNVAMRLAGARRQAPRAIAEELVEQATALPQVERAEIAGPGFVNLWLARDWYGDALAEILAAGESYGSGSAAIKHEHSTGLFTKAGTITANKIIYLFPPAFYGIHETVGAVIAQVILYRPFALVVSCVDPSGLDDLLPDVAEPTAVRLAVDPDGAARGADSPPPAAEPTDDHPAAHLEKANAR